jgi:hypothetical protein
MQAQKTAPPDLQIKDKFLVQTTAIPAGITDEGIIPAFVSSHYTVIHVPFVTLFASFIPSFNLPDILL